MISDGSIVRQRPGRAPVISIELKSTDKYIIEDFAEHLGATKDCVHDSMERGHSYFRFASQEMANDLAQYGVIERKTGINYFPVLTADMMPHAIRGYFDGNGTVTVTKEGYVRFALYGSQFICEELRQFLHDEIGLSLNTVGKSTCHHIWWSGEKQARAFYEYIYDNCDDLFLKRKREKFDINM